MTRDTPQPLGERDVAQKSIRTPPGAISCKGCGAVFQPRRPSQRYCRPACRPLAQRRRESERRASLLERLLPDDPGRAE